MYLKRSKKTQQCRKQVQIEPSKKGFLPVDEFMRQKSNSIKHDTLTPVSTNQNVPEKDVYPCSSVNGTSEVESNGDLPGSVHEIQLHLACIACMKSEESSEDSNNGSGDNHNSSGDNNDSGGDNSGGSDNNGDSDNGGDSSTGNGDSSNGGSGSDNSGGSRKKGGKNNSKNKSDTNDDNDGDGDDNNNERVGDYARQQVSGKTEILNNKEAHTTHKCLKDLQQEFILEHRDISQGISVLGFSLQLLSDCSKIWEASM
jgi:hypothetical protein